VKLRVKRRSSASSGVGEGYDPDRGPEGAAWLAMDEQLRAIAVEKYHRAAHIRVPNLRVHSLLHVVVENQLAQAYEPASRALTRLMAEGLGRHEAVHAIGSVLAGQVHAIATDQQADPGVYEVQLNELTVEKWRGGAG
jgi:hypothetical protein